MQLYFNVSLNLDEYILTIFKVCDYLILVTLSKPIKTMYPTNINIEQHLSQSVVTSCLKKHQKLFTNSEKLPKFKYKLLELNFTLKGISQEYQHLFDTEVRTITDSLINYQEKYPNKFSNYLLDKYKSVRSLFNPKHLTEPCPLNMIDVQINGNQLQHVMRGVRYKMQKEFVKPLLDFIENNYLRLLLEENVFPAPIKNILNEINQDELHLKQLHEEIQNNSYHGVFSKQTSKFHHIEYNSYTDLLSYRTHLNSVYLLFVQCFEKVEQKITDSDSRLVFYNKIKTYLVESLSQFEIITKQKQLHHVPMPNFMRKDTLALLKQYVIESFAPEQNILFSPGLGDFQDLQYSIGKKALLHLEAKIKIMQYNMNLHKQHDTSSNNKPGQFEFKKIKTELTVNQIAVLLRILIEEKGIIDESVKIELCRKVVNIVSSSNMEDISAKSLNNRLSKYDHNAVNFWIEKLTHLLQIAKKIRDNGNSQYV